MKKVGIILLTIITLVSSMTIIDYIYLYMNNKPLFVLKTEETKYTGLFYDIYNCPEYSWFVVKSKFTKFNCAVELKKEPVIEKEYIIDKIEDETIGRTDLVFAQALEKFYEDETSEYFFSCIKGSYINVTYKNGEKETVASALEKGRIKISDLNRFGIKYYREFKKWKDVTGVT